MPLIVHKHDKICLLHILPFKCNIRITRQTVVRVAQMSRVLCRSVLSLRLIRVPMARSASSYLIEDPKYSFLKELGLREKNVGVFNGKWEANGQVS